MKKTSKLKRYSRLAYHRIKSYFLTEVFLRTGKFMPKPTKLYYAITNKCNFRCQMCPQWKDSISESVADYIGEDRMRKIIDEMNKLKINEFGISGGEPLIFRDRVFSLLQYANSKGLYTHFVTNGSLLTKGDIERYNDIGGGHISISVDAIGDKHDELRGFPGAFDGVKKAIKALGEAESDKVVLKINIVLTNSNLDEVIDVVKMAVDAKAMVFVQSYDSFNYSDISKRDNYSLWIQEDNMIKLKKVVAELIEMKRRYPQYILNNVKYLKDIVKYFKDEKLNRTCFAGLDQIFVNPQGQVIFCKYRQIGDLEKQSLKEFLNDPSRIKVVKDSLKCRIGCMLGCMYRPSFWELLINGPKQFWKLIRK